MENKDELKSSINKGYINSSIIANEDLVPKVIVNNWDEKEKVSTVINQELKTCNEFMFTVAFVTECGVMSLYSSLEELENKNVKGIIIASQYQNFTTPKALRLLLQFKNIDLYMIKDDVYHMHSKGYVFKKEGDLYTVIVGSSNLTSAALTKNLEWNLKVTSNKDGEIVKNTLAEYESLKRIANKVDETFIDEYEKAYIKREEIIKKFYGDIDDIKTSEELIIPNRMQEEALKNLKEARGKGKDRALIISATGTGKTYLAAFDVKEFKPKKFLFIVHRERIAKEAMKSFKKVCGNNIKMGVLGGGNKPDTDCQYVFAMIETLSRSYKNYKSDEFDYIIVDEAHRVCAKTYQEVLVYFKPKFLLGMTATPDRPDSNNEEKDVYKFFNYNIPYEIRLQNAMDMDLICPFHYFGITDFYVDDKNFDEGRDFNKLIAKDRVDHIIKEINKHSWYGNRVKGLVFCSSVMEAKTLSSIFNNRGYHTVALCGDNSDKEREEAIEKLEQDEKEGSLDFIFLKDIFNEGIDIPAINEVIMLRPTESAIVFIQQLGRGLRKLQGKEYVVILDFIANYKNNFLIPVALSGDNSGNRGSARRIVQDGSKMLYGASTINFDAITKERIYESIDSTRFGDAKLLEQSYNNLKERLGHIPRMIDFATNDSINVLRYVEKWGSYQKFLSIKENKNGINYSELELDYLKFISSNFANGFRPHELVLMDILLRDNQINIKNDFKIQMKKEYPNLLLTEKDIISAFNILDGSFFRGNTKALINNNGSTFTINDEFKQLIVNKPEFKNAIMEIIEYAKKTYKDSYSKTYDNTCLKLYEQYTRRDVCRLLDWDKDETATIFGYKYDRKTNTLPIFVTYNKEENITESTKYGDRFESPDKFYWYTRSVKISSKSIYEYADIKDVYEAKDNNAKILLFVKKMKDDKNFYLLGGLDILDNGKEEKMNEEYRVLGINMKVKNTIRHDVYDYLKTEIIEKENTRG